MSIKGLTMAMLAALLTFGVRAEDQVFHDEVQQQTYAMANPHFDILIVTVVSMESGPFTNERPPQGVVRVQEVLRGREKVGTTYPIRWQSISPPEYEESGGLQDGANIAARRLKPDWANRRVAAPTAGDRFIVLTFGITKGWIRVEDAYRVSDENRSFVTRHMAPPERYGIVQGAAFLFILAAPVACILLHFRSRSPRLTDRQKGRARLALALAVPVAIAVYAFYESGVSIYSNIRADLLVLWPALGLTVAIAGISLLLFALRQPPSGKE